MQQNHNQHVIRLFSILERKLRELEQERARANPLHLGGLSQSSPASLPWDSRLHWAVAPGKRP